MELGTSSETRGGSLAAEAAALSRPSSCDGTDSHTFGWSGRRRLFVSAGSIVFLLLSIGVGATGLIWVGAGVVLGAVLGSGMTVRVNGDVLLANRFGVQTRVPLEDVARVDRYAYRGSVSLRLWLADGSRAPSIPVKAWGYRLDPAAAQHLLRYLNRPGVNWERGAWETLTADAPKTSGSSPGERTPAGRPTAGPRGRLLPAKPLSGWQRVLAYLSAAALVCSTAALLVVTPLNWLDYAESQRIQHGPDAIATLQGESVSASTDRYGTHRTTHFLVAFVTADGRPIRTVLDAHGRYQPLPIGDRFPVRYDPGAPSHTELPGAPMHTLGFAIWLTVITTVLVLSVVAGGRAIWRVRTLRGNSDVPATVA